ncbi:hypothetical protein [Bacillus thuringiensis]|uniref:hypothetical protein n=1 Tax=Bacillus thuringiensis TaxID=1428 RepID=UPI00366EBFD2
MQELRFEDYRNKQRETERFYRSPEERQETKFIRNFGMRIIGTANAFTVRDGTDVFGKNIQFLNTKGKIIHYPVEKNSNNQSPLIVRKKDEIAINRMRGIQGNEDSIQVMDEHHQLAKQERPEQIETLKVFSENQERVHKGIFGDRIKELKSLEYYMKKYGIPEWAWEGQRPGYDLNNVKVNKVEGAKGNFKFRESNNELFRWAPGLHEDKEDLNIISKEENSSFEGFNILKKNLINNLQETGLRNIQVKVTPSHGTETYVNFSYHEDRREEIENHLKKYANRYV